MSKTDLLMRCLFSSGRFLALLAALLWLSLPVPAVSAQTDAFASNRPLELNVGVLAYSPPWYDGAFLEETIDYLEWKLPHYRFHVEYLDSEDLRMSVSQQRLDLVACGSTFYYTYLSLGLRDIAALVSDTSTGSNRASAAAVVVRKDRTDLRQLKDLRGLRVGTVKGETSPGIYEVLTEIARFDDSPEKFFGEILEEKPLNMRQVLERVASGEIDAGIVRACFLEDLEQAGSLTETARLRVLEHKDSGDALACRHTTRSYPGWVFAASERLPEHVARDISAMLLTKPSNAWGQHWSVLTDYSETSRMLQTLKVGPYAYLRQWTVRRFIEEFWPFIVIAIFSLIGLVVHGAILSKLVQKRTAELEQVYVQRQAAERLARENSEKLDALQRLGAVGQISGIVAHEMKQPLASIQNLAHGALRILEDDEASSEEVVRAVYNIEDEASKAARIVERVRSYSRGQSLRSAIDSRRAIEDIVGQFRSSGKGRFARIETERIDSVQLMMVPIDLELIVINLLTNAAEAAAQVADPEIVVSAIAADDQLSINVSDNGPNISQKDFNELGSSVLRSTKANGLGLGLMIVRTLAKNYIGRVEFERRLTRGLTVRVILPAQTAPHTTPSDALGRSASNSSPNNTKQTEPH